MDKPPTSTHKREKSMSMPDNKGYRENSYWYIRNLIDYDTTFYTSTNKLAKQKEMDNFLSK